MKAVVAARSHANPVGWCNCCDNTRKRTALLYLTEAAGDKTLRICAGCVRSLLYAARATKKRKTVSP